jgi:hypothetical protein
MRLLARTWRYFNRRHLVAAIAGGILISISVSLSTLQLNLFRKHNEFLNAIWWYVPMAAVFVLAVVIIEANAPRRRPPLRAYVLAAVIAATLCMAGAYVAGPSLQLGRRDVPGFPNPGNYQQVHARPTAIFSIGFEGVMHCVIGMFVYVRLRNARFTAMALGQTQRRATEAARAAAEARLDSVRDRVDPGTLTLTLEDIERLYWIDPSRADAQLDELIEFLRAAIPQTRRESWKAPEPGETLVHAAE